MLATELFCLCRSDAAQTTLPRINREDTEMLFSMLSQMLDHLPEGRRVAAGEAAQRGV